MLLPNVLPSSTSQDVRYGSERYPETRCDLPLSELSCFPYGSNLPYCFGVEFRLDVPYSDWPPMPILADRIMDVVILCSSE